MGGKDSVLNRTSNHLLLKYYLMSAFNPLSSSPSRARKAEGGLRRMKQLENYIAVLESRNPSLSSLVQMKVEEECAVFEEKSEQILSILREKDEKIASLQVELELSADHPHLERVVEDTAREMEKWKEEAKTERREHQKTICALSSLQEEFERLRVHYNALLGENIALREKELDQTQHIQVDTE